MCHAARAADACSVRTAGTFIVVLRFRRLARALDLAEEREMNLYEMYRVRAAACERLAARASENRSSAEYRLLAQHWREIAEQIRKDAPISEVGLTAYRSFIQTRVAQ